MLQITPQMKIFVSIDPVDFRAGIDGLCRICREELRSDPFSGAVFVFRNRRGSGLKLLCYDGQGFWLCQKRLSHGHFRYWPKRTDPIPSEMMAHELHVLIMGGDPTGTQAAAPWRTLSSSRVAAP